MMTKIDKVVRVGTTEVYEGKNASVFVHIQYDDKRLSITGVVGPLRGGDCLGSCGQITDTLKEIVTYAPNWDAASVARLYIVWDRWHLNDMRAGCEHQRANWDTQKEIEVVSYRLTSETLTQQNEIKSRSLKALEKFGRYEMMGDEQLILSLPWEVNQLQYEELLSNPRGIASLYKEMQRRKKAAGWVYPKEHRDGLLTKPCEECGYAYGSSWLHEAVPQDVLDWLLQLPDTDIQPAWI